MPKQSGKGKPGKLDLSVDTLKKLSDADAAQVKGGAAGPVVSGSRVAETTNLSLGGTLSAAGGVLNKQVKW